MTHESVSPGLAEEEPRIEVIDRPEDIIAGFDCACKTFGEQTHDAIWMAMNPEWDRTGPDGKQRAAARMVDQWRRITYDNQGNANTIFLKATVSCQGERVVAGMAIWAQLSMVEGYGERPSADLRSDLDLDALYPDDEAEKRYLCQVYRSLVKRRVEVVQEKVSSHPPSLMHLQLVCSIIPSLSPGFRNWDILVYLMVELFLPGTPLSF